MKRNGKESIPPEEDQNRDEQEDPTPLTDEEFARYQKKQKRESGIICDIIDTIVHFFS